MFSTNSETVSLFGNTTESESRSLFSSNSSISTQSGAGGCVSNLRYGAVSIADTKWLTSPEKCLRHKPCRTDTLQGISVKYSVPIELIKSINKLWNPDYLFLRDELLIPVPNELVRRSKTPDKSATNNDVLPNNISTLQSPPASTPEDTDRQLSDLFSRFDRVLQSTKESTEKLRSNSNLDFSPQVANIARSASTVSIVEPGPHGSRTSSSSSGRTRYRRGRRDFYTDDELPASSSDEIYLL